MIDTCDAKKTRLEFLHELFASATHDASAVMCRWTDGLITVTLDEVQEIPLEQVAPALGIGDELLTMVVLALQGPVGGNMILVFDDQSARQLAASLLGREVGTEPEWTPAEQSALTETGNILGCAYMNALTRLIDTELVPSAPYFLQDFGASVLQQALMAQAMTCDELLICRIGFRCRDRSLDWRVIFVPTQDMQQAMEQAIHSAR
jgi:chemotaxis protein CheC